MMMMIVIYAKWKMEFSFGSMKNKPFIDDDGKKR